MKTVTMPENNWRAIHGGLLELCRLWSAGVSLSGMERAGREEIEEIMQRILPVLSHASSWPEVAEFEGETRELLGLPVSEELLAASRMLVREEQDRK